MTVTMLRKICSSLLLIATGLTGFWFGEGNVALVSTTALLAFVAMPLAAVAVAPRRDPSRVRMRLVAGALLFIGAWTAGQTSLHKAVEDCVLHGEEVRLALRAYRLQHGEFPEQLSELPVELPGGRLLHPSILDYQRVERDYRLSFTNAGIRYLANARYPFLLPGTKSALAP